MTPPDAVLAAPVRFTPARGPIAAARKYFKIFRASLVERMTYRGDFLFGTILRFLPLVTTILLWEAIYRGVPGGTSKGELGGAKVAFSYREMIAYLLLTNISRMFSSMPGLAGGIARDIRDGSLKKYMIQPVDLIGYLLAYRARTRRPTSSRRFCPTPCSSSSAARTSTAFPTPLPCARTLSR